MSAPAAYPGFLYGQFGQRIYPSPMDSPGKYRPRQIISREIKRSISQYDHSELVSISTQLCCRIPALRGAIRDKNTWAFAHWSPMHLGENEKWGEEVEEWLLHEVMPNACMNELRTDYQWGMRISGMAMDIHADDLAIFTEDEYHNPRIMFVPGPRIGNGPGGTGYMANVMSMASGFTMRPDGQSVTAEGKYKDAPIYNGIIRVGGKPVAARVLGVDDKGNPTFADIDLGFTYGTHYANEYEWFGQGRPVPRIAASVLQWLKKEEIDDQLLKALALAASRAVVHKIPPGQDAMMARGNAIEMSTVSAPVMDGVGGITYDANGNPITQDSQVYVEYSPDGNVTYIGSDENIEGLKYDMPSAQVEEFAVRVLRECLRDLGWSHELLDMSSTGRAPTRLTTEAANLAIHDRQTVQKRRTIEFIRYAVSKGIKNKQIPPNDAGMDAYKWGIGFPAQMSVDQGNDVTASLQRLKMGLTNERIEAAKDGHVAKHILRQRVKEIYSKLDAADGAYSYVQAKGHKDFTFQQAMELFYQPNPNSSAVMKMTEAETNPAEKTEKPPQQK